VKDKIHQVYKSIEFRPDQFNDYLLSSDVGFASCELIGTPFHESKGTFFERSTIMLWHDLSFVNALYSVDQLSFS
jgi:Bicoid-interacting protein 3 (Bin3)